MFVRGSEVFRPILMQPNTNQIATAFAPETEVEIKIKSQHRTFEIPELLVLPREELSVRTSLNLNVRRGIPFSAIND
jgi:hypothetical protein